MQDKHKSILLRVLFIVSVLGMLPLLGGLGSKLGLWQPMTGFRMTMRYMGYSSISALIVLYFIFRYFIRDNRRAISSYVMALLFAGAGYFYGVNQEGADWTGLRGIHDVTTDTDNPPQFVELLGASGRSNSFDYPSQTAERQTAKFPWIKPIFSELPPAEAYERALMIAKELNWDVVGEDQAGGRFEATDYTKWFNFHDDLVVKVSANGSGSRIDLRSLSRVGSSDHGLGAIRIMKFQQKFIAG